MSYIPSSIDLVEAEREAKKWKEISESAERQWKVLKFLGLIGIAISVVLALIT